MDRLPLLRPEELTDEQRPVYEMVCDFVVPEGKRDGFTTRLDDGRLIGPFNALLRNPRITTAFGGWVRAIAQSGLAADVRQAVILTVAAHWQAPYEIYAHTAAAATAGIAEAAIEAILAGERPPGLSPAAALAQRCTATLLREHDVPDALYEEVVTEFGEAGTVALLALIGQYQTISALLVTFRVPVPD